MSVTALLIRQVTILRADETTDRYGNAVLDWSTPTETPTKGWMAQSSSTEDTDRRDAAVSTWTLVLGPDEDVTAADRVAVDGTVYELLGAPNVAWSRRGPHHIEATLRLVEG